MRTENDSYVSCTSFLLSSKNDVLRLITIVHLNLWFTPIKNTRKQRRHRCFWFLVMYVELIRSVYTRLRKHVVPTHSDWTPDCNVLLLSQPRILFSSWSFLLSPQSVRKEFRRCVYLVKNWVFRNPSKTHFWSENSLVKKQSWVMSPRVILVNYGRVIYRIHTLTFYKVKGRERHMWCLWYRLKLIGYDDACSFLWIYYESITW